jgi:inorganic triphosphatase YgiF
MQEIELKLSLPGVQTAHVQRVLDTVAQRVGEKTLRNIYFDTPDKLLHRQRMALRLRQQSQDGVWVWIQTLKMGGGSDSALSQRGEWESVVPDASLSRQVLRQTPWAQFDAGGALFEALQPCFETQFQRTFWWAQGSGYQIEVALDQGEVKAGDARSPIAELEFELRAGAPEVLFEVAARIAMEVPILPAYASKAQHGFGLAAGSLAVPRQRHDYRSLPLEQRVVKVLHDAFAQLCINLNAWMHAHSDALLHQCLLAVRRFNAARILLASHTANHLPELPLWSAVAATVHRLQRRQETPGAHQLMDATLLHTDAGLELLQASRWLALELF